LQSAASQAVLSIACGVAIIGFSLSVLFDVVTRQIGHPWLWLQELTSGCFVYRIFLGMALAARRNEHMYLSEIVQSMHGASRRNTEVFARLVVLAVAACLVVFGWQNFLLDLGSYRMPSLIPLGYYTIVVPVAGALVGLFQIEQLVNGMRNGFDRQGALIREGIE
jgi:TRAP-type C4-dicarboxylate transport system permease small subunit